MFREKLLVARPERFAKQSCAKAHALYSELEFSVPCDCSLETFQPDIAHRRQRGDTTDS